VGGFLGGVQWGMATDDRKIFVANSDVITTENGRPGLFALDPATGKDLWYVPSPTVPCSWTNGAPCFRAQSAAPFAIPRPVSGARSPAPFAIPGAGFGGSTDGHERAYAAADGKILWDFDTAHGAIDVSSGSLADGMLFLISGYRGILGGGSDNVLEAFSVDGR